MRHIDKFHGCTNRVFGTWKESYSLSFKLANGFEPTFFFYFFRLNFMFKPIKEMLTYTKGDQHKPAACFYCFYARASDIFMSRVTNWLLVSLFVSWVWITIFFFFFLFQFASQYLNLNQEFPFKPINQTPYYTLTNMYQWWYSTCRFAC